MNKKDFLFYSLVVICCILNYLGEDSLIKTFIWIVLIILTIASVTAGFSRKYLGEEERLEESK